MSVFVDANILIAAANPRDRMHDRAASVLREVRAPWTTDHVLVEAWAVLASRTSPAGAEAFLGAFMHSAVALEFVGPADLERALAIGERWADQGFDLVDRTAFAAMERLGCARAATFDRDFAVYRYGPARDRAFEIVDR